MNNAADPIVLDAEVVPAASGGGRRVRWVVGLIVALGVLGVIGWRVYVQVQAKQQEAEGRPRGAVVVAVEVAPVRTATLRDVGLFTGTLLPASQFVVAPKVPGRLKQLRVNIGDPVRQGDLIAVLDDEEYALQVEQVQAELDVAKANVDESASNLAASKREFERVQSLRATKVASEAELDVAQSQYLGQQAKNRVAQAVKAQRESALRAAQVRRSYTQVRAAWEDAGDSVPRVVGERFVDEGALLTANAAIVSILDIHTLTASITVVERDYPKVAAGQSVLLTTDAFPGQSFPGTVKRIAPLLKETSRQARVEVDVPNPGEVLRPGLFVRVETVFATHPDVTAVPEAALVKREGKQGVFLVEQTEAADADPPSGPPARPARAGPSAPAGRSGTEGAAPGAKPKVPALVARFVPVTTGIEENGLVEVLSPALAGRVVTLGQYMLNDGSSIMVSEAPATGPATGPAGDERRPPGAERREGAPR